jgi:hypothetical protein
MITKYLLKIIIMKMNISLVLLIGLTITILSCSKSNIENVTELPKQKLAEGFVVGASVKAEVYAQKALNTGYNNIYVVLFDSISNQKIENAVVSFMPMMDMGSMKHSAPAENPTTVDANKMYNGAVVFLMPSGTMGSWTLDIMVQYNGKMGKLTVPVNIATPSVSTLKSFISKVDNAKYFVALLQPEVPKVGVNDLEIAIYKYKSMMAYPADSSLSVIVTPEMPTMGHGSPNNVNPVHIGRGHYKGKVNFTMTGLWYLNLDFNAGSAVADSTIFFERNF